MRVWREWNVYMSDGGRCRENRRGGNAVTRDRFPCTLAKGKDYTLCTQAFSYFFFFYSLPDKAACSSLLPLFIFYRIAIHPG